MVLGEPVAEAEVVAEFLRAEIESPRFGPRIRARLAQDGRPETIIGRPDTSSDADNAYRAALLHGYRGVGGSAPLLEGLPDRMEWYRARLTRADLERVRYIEYPYWVELSAGTRSPAVAASRIRAGITAMNRPNDAFLAVSARLCAGEQLGTTVLVAPDRAAALVVLEGHTRVTAMLLRPECMPAEVPMLVGFAAGVREWPYYGSPDGGS